MHVHTQTHTHTQIHTQRLCSEHYFIPSHSPSNTIDSEAWSMQAVREPRLLQQCQQMITNTPTPTYPPLHPHTRTNTCTHTGRTQSYASSLPTPTASLAWRLRRPPRKWQTWSLSPACTVGTFLGRVIPVTQKKKTNPGTPASTLPRIARYWVSIGSGWPSVSIL